MATDVPIRCFCPKRCLLAIGRTDALGAWVIHVRVHKGGKLISEVVADHGPLWVRCRECLRWHKLTIRMQSVHHRAEHLPDGITLPPVALPNSA